MPNLHHSLQDHDIGHLRMVAERWGVEPEGANLRTMRTNLADELLEPELAEEVVHGLPADARNALAQLQQNLGRIDWVQFTHQYGEIRRMGRSQRDRIRPDREPVSTTEILYYRALVGRAYFDTNTGPQEFAYIPEDLLAIMPILAPESDIPLGRPAAPAETAAPQLASDQLLDTLTTILAARRINQDLPGSHQSPFYASLLQALGLLDAGGQPLTERIRDFLAAPRGQCMRDAFQSWRISPDHNDLHHVPSLTPDGDWPNDPVREREALFELLHGLPHGEWWNLPAFISAIKQRQPGFLRPDGDYESWYLQDADGKFLTGFEFWDQVEGAWLAYMLTGPLHWLGYVDLARGAAENISAFRLSRWAGGLWDAAVPKAGLTPEDGRVHIRSDGQINIPRSAPRTARYQVARFCRWDEPKPEEYRYRITPSSLERAKGQGLTVDHFIQILSAHSDGIPPNVTKALKNWQAIGHAAKIETHPILRLPAPEVLDALRKSRAARFLGTPLNTTTITLKPGTEEKVLAILVEMGYLGEVE